MERLVVSGSSAPIRIRPKVFSLLGWAAAGCVFGISPALASGTAAGTAISNTASATYTDPNNSGTTLNATSNTVSVTVAEVAGITAVGAGLTNSNGHAQPLPGDIVYYDYTLTNVGNDPTGIAVPATATITGPGTQGTLQYKTGANAFANVPGGGITVPTIQAGQTVTVRVPVTVNATAATGQALAVLLGSTGPNDNSAATQNQPYSANSGLDVHTIDGADGSGGGEISGAPVGGEKEASATQQAAIGSQPQAFAAVGLTHTGFTPGVSAKNGILAYGLSLQVLSAPPSGALPSLAAADYTPTNITVGGSTVARVLIADAIPANTVLTGTPAAPSGWTALYTITPTTTIAQNAAWTTTPPADLTTVTRIGFATANTIAKGASVTGFAYSVITSGVITTAATQIAAIAQTFGQSAGDSANALVYDESGDAAPANFNDDGSRGSSTPTTGIASPAADGTDAANNNTGTGPGGEDNVYTVQPDGTVFNGPHSQPAAVGPTDTNDDFTNQSTLVPAGLAPGATFDPAALSFANTVSNPSGNAISAKIYLLPQPPATLPGGSAADLPSGTTMTLTYGGNSAVYTYNGTAWTLTSGTAIYINGLAANTTADYAVSVDLPAGTPLSTDTGKGFPVPVQAFIDNNSNGTFDTGEAANLTIDRAYTGYLKLTKQARIVDTDGTTVLQAYSSAPASAYFTPGRFIDYQITYSNISSAAAGSGNVTLSVSGLSINEDGTATPNNWAKDNDGNGVADTAHVSAQATDSGTGATITFFAGGSASTDSDPNVTRYVDTITPAIAPGQSRTFTFRRRIN